MSVDTIGDFLTIIRNGIARSKPSVELPYSKLKHNIALLFKQEGFIRDVAVEEQEGLKHLKIVLKYVNGESVIHEIKRLSTPGRRLYRGASKVQPVIGGLGLSVLTTNRGLMTDKQARTLGVGGEVICTIW
jgi:small subunit ribosomal protein S8